ncbi:predicted protein [Naegleria gruberi]|uniref:Predicted protein n=1 Tax=Naegleria gruberi TaxID=5762 RepID=D2VXP3_NAEGR|nr:uncharacterized protein NAEGRDRAFT_53070 [Naegleria gruberi]EFC38373.1 predicted protein [Naegleria gruberi]|eukprot:XP_002671117.1 predicted protein [Naegleria gruberi strain NEG-M]
MPNSIVSSSSNYNRSHITDLSISIISDKNKPRPQSASSSRRGSITNNNNNNNSKHLMEDDLNSLRSFQKLSTGQNNGSRPSSAHPKFKQKEVEKENNIHINTSAYKLDHDDNVSEPVSWGGDAVSIRSYNNSPSLNNSKNSQRPQSSFVYSIAKRAPIIPRPGSAPLTKKGKLDSSHRSKTPSELYDESFYEMQRRDESNAAITNPWHQTLDEHHERPLITTVLHEYRDDISTSRCSSRMSDKKDFIEINKHALSEKVRNAAKRNSITARPHSYVLDNSFEGSASDFSTSAHLEGEERRRTHTSLMQKYSTRQSVPRTVNSRTIFNPSTLAYDNSSSLKNRPKSALSKVMYKQTTRHQDVVSIVSDTLRPRSAMSTYSVKESFKRPTSEEPFKRSSSFLNVQGFSINQAKVVHEGHYEMPRTTKRGAPRPEPQPHTIALCVHNSRFSIENQ